MSKTSKIAIPVIDTSPNFDFYPWFPFSKMPNLKVQKKIKRKIRNYSQKDIDNALDAVRNGMSFKSAAKSFNVPRITLMCKYKGKTPVECRLGPSGNLSMEEENILVSWLFHVADMGFPATKIQLIDSVHLLCKNLNRNTNFKNGRPGKKWYQCFLKRHPEVSRRISQNLTTARSSVTEKNIRDWFAEVFHHVIENNYENIFEDPRRIFNADETAFFLTPKGQKVLVRAGEKSVYNFVANDEKECITTLVTANAAGQLVPPMIVWKYERIPSTISSLMPEKWGLGKSETGWMTGETFYEFVTNIMYPWILENSIPLPVIFFVDGHASHLTLSLSEFCKENKIALLALYPNSTHILQPMDVGVFHPLKNGWKNGVHQWRIENEGIKLRKEHFAPLLKTVMDNHIKTETIINSFRTCGLCPFNVNAINYKKFFKNTLTNVETETNKIGGPSKLLLNLLEKRLLPHTLSRFRESGKIWIGAKEDTSLFDLWYTLVNEVNSITNEKLHTETENVPLVANENETNELQCQTSSAGTSTQNKKIHILQNIIVTPGIDNNSGNIQNINCSPVQDLTSSRSTFAPIEFNQQSTPIKNNSNDVVLVHTSMEAEASTSASHIPFILESTPQKDVPCPKEFSLIPTPFKKSLFWPQSNKENKPKRRKEKIPSVATSDQWREYHLKKKLEKEKKELDKLERKRKREEKKAENEKKLKQKKKILKDEWSSNSSVEINYEESSDGEIDETEEEFEQDLNYNVCDYVIFKYEGIHYPGQIKKIVKNVFSISAMQWPKPKDLLEYPLEDIIQKIGPPLRVNSRGVYKVVELCKYV